MPESEAEKELRREREELARSLREDGKSPIPDDPKPREGVSRPTGDDEPFEMRQGIKFISDDGKTTRFEDLTDRQIAEQSLEALLALPEALAAILEGAE